MAGLYFEDLEPGREFEHPWSRTVTEMDNVLFSSLTLNAQPLHINEDFASKTEFGQRLVNGLFTLALVVGISVGDTTQGTIIANLGYENIKHPHPLFHGDTLYVETEVVAKRDSQSRPNAGLVTMKHTGRNQHGAICVEVTRTALFLKRSAVEG